MNNNKNENKVHEQIHEQKKRIIVPDMYYISVKGELGEDCCTVFGLNEEEIKAINKKIFLPLKDNKVCIPNGYMFSKDPITIVNLLSGLNYRVISTCCEGGVVWTLVRPIYSN